MDPNEALELLRSFIGQVLDIGRFTTETVERGGRRLPRPWTHG